ncbi:MAG: ribosome-associated translation inhibitor RaiA [Acidobacteriota bacterium]
MRLALTGRQIDITPAMRRLVERKMARLDRILNDKGVSGQVELSIEKFRRMAEVHVHARGGHMLQGHVTATSWDEAVSGAVDKIVQQAQRLVGKWQARKREARPLRRATEGVLAPTLLRRIVRARRYAVKPLTLEQAAQSVGETADAFVVFRHTATNAVSVLFRRKDGDLGLIEPGV